MTAAMRERVADLARGWRKRGHELEFKAGIALGYATLGKIGFEGRFDYGAVGTITRIVTQLCEDARGGQILISQRVLAAAEDLIESEAVDHITVKGLSRPVATFNIVRLRSQAQPAPDATQGEQQAGDRAGLTQREVEVLALVAQGLTNAEVAERLIVSPLTVHAHLRSIFSKLGVTSRSAATRWAVEHRLA